MHRAKHPIQKPVLLLVDYPIQNEVDNDIPWSGASHLSLLSDLAKVGISQRYIHTSYLSYERPSKDSYDWSTDFKKKKNLSEEQAEDWFALPHQKDLYISPELAEQFLALLQEIKTVQPKLIIVAGKWSLFFLSGQVAYSATQGSGKSQKPLGGLSKYRASIERVHSTLELPECIMFPMLPPVTKQRSPDKVPVLKWDCLKVADIYKGITELEKPIDEFLNPEREFIIGTEIDIVLTWLNCLLIELNQSPVLVSVDIETRHSSMIDCIGFAYSNKSGICIPFSTLDSPCLWSEEDELKIYTLMSKVLNHENCKVTGQNYSYDSQFIKKFWLIDTQATIDTMILHHVLYNNMQKDLAFLASIYCENYQYWKDDQIH